MGLCKGIEEEGGVVVLGVDAGPVRQSGAEDGALVKVVGSGSVHVHLLQEIEVGVLLLEQGGDLVEILLQTLLGPGPGLGAAVHEEAVVVLIGAEADVVAEGPVGPAGAEGFGDGVFHCEGLVVRDTVVSQKDIGHIGGGQHQHRQEQDQKDFQRFAHGEIILSSVQNFPAGTIQSQSLLCAQKPGENDLLYHHLTILAKGEKSPRRKGGGGSSLFPAENALECRKEG